MRAPSPRSETSGGAAGLPDRRNRSATAPGRPPARSSVPIPPLDGTLRLADAGRVGDDDRAGPSRSSRTSMTSRVVPASSDTIAASRRASAFSRLDLPTLGGPASTTRKAVAQDLAAVAVVEVERDRRLQVAVHGCAPRRTQSAATSASSEKSMAAFDQARRVDEPRRRQPS